MCSKCVVDLEASFDIHEQISVNDRFYFTSKRKKFKNRKANRQVTDDSLMSEVSSQEESNFSMISRITVTEEADNEKEQTALVEENIPKSFTQDEISTAKTDLSTKYNEDETATIDNNRPTKRMKILTTQNYEFDDIFLTETDKLSESMVLITDDKSHDESDNSSTKRRLSEESSTKVAKIFEINRIS